MVFPIRSSCLVKQKCDPHCSKAARVPGQPVRCAANCERVQADHPRSGLARVGLVSFREKHTDDDQWGETAVCHCCSVFLEKKKKKKVVKTLRCQFVTTGCQAVAAPSSLLVMLVENYAFGGVCCAELGLWKNAIAS